MTLVHSITSLATALLLSLPTIASANEAAVPVAVTDVRNAVVKEVVRLTGTVTSARAARLSPATSGLVTALHVDAGSRVQAGQLLLELDSELASWQAQSAQAGVQAAQVALEDARRRLREARALAPQQSIAETLVHDLAAEVAGDDAALQQASAEAGYRSAILARHQLQAPYAGVISAKLSEVGEWVVPGDAVLELVATGDLRIDFTVAEDYLARMQAGARVTYNAGGAGSEARSGSIATVVPVSDPGARTFLLRVEPDSATADLAPGMSVHGQVHLDAGRSAPVVPRDAIIRYPDGRVIVWTVERDGDATVVAERLVRTGLVFDGLVEIRAGLAPGARVVVQGNEALQVGQPVSVTEARAD
ncbi:MAG: efflux transporter periplasmic adaptor subunit [Halioglobus sp.]|nr:efflux transporter periplasmic adaptor subunit [Halioglobus sp.]|tara:strand:+ start:3799 stop:4884 length:1086 start_codon:yes stop_codon:yes gene_type:complete